ncbi:hypothetical protein AB0M43_35040 [Longispora sp. NPDC051575]|uniref:hypothetical protein n=1 Tax=Longispora sp. NPDC051575 TaxID=3154943 RepID=UPI00344AE72D
MTSPADDRAPRAFGLARMKPGQADCGLCGLSAPMTKAHVPAQMAGNGPTVRRARYVSKLRSTEGKERFVELGRAADGGLWVYGLCDPCNRVIQAPFEIRYKELAAMFKGLWNRDLTLSVPSPVTVPDVIFHPGAVARAVVIGMYAMNPALRGLYPQLADTLGNGDAKIVLPPDLKLRLAIARGRGARIAGGGGGLVIGQTTAGKPVGIISFGSIYFPPLAWQFVASDAAPLLDRQGWADVSNWLEIDPADERLFSTVCTTSLPLAMHPTHDPAFRHTWIELGVPGSSESVECANLPSNLLGKL